LTEQVPRYLGEVFGIAISAPQEKDQRVLGQFLDRMLICGICGDVGTARVSDNRCAGYLELSSGSDETGAPVAEPITIG
jgi:hypothetical protein